MSGEKPVDIDLRLAKALVEMKKEGTIKFYQFLEEFENCFVDSRAIIPREEKEIPVIINDRTQAIRGASDLVDGRQHFSLTPVKRERSFCM